ncbi:DUF2752 domain-containing protein [Aquimarina muelleri]|uniref:DUF2752 domain-containing protein n=1 Tax=Aquimarina muelleri TaxID=279356 RepID=A0A918N5W5_9FLAO|nr:hypothetical protein GCM10007384_36870 [Aquimarina muelleri]
MEILINQLESSTLKCPGKELIGLNCLGCGLQRSFILLLKGNLIDSFLMYPALIPIIIMFVYLIVHLFLNFKKGAKTLQYFYLLNTILIIANYIIKF